MAKDNLARSPTSITAVFRPIASTGDTARTPCPIPVDIRLFPKAGPTKKAYGGKKAWKNILTITPVKDKLLEEHTQKMKGRKTNPQKNKVRKQTPAGWKNEKKAAESPESESDVNGPITMDGIVYVGNFLQELTDSSTSEIT